MITNTFQSVVKKSNRKRNKMWLNKGDECYSRSMKYGLKVMTYKFIQHIISENKHLQNDLLKY